MPTITTDSTFSGLDPIPTTDEVVVSGDVESVSTAAGVAALVEELGLDDFVDRAPVDRMFAPTMEHGLGLCFRRKDYDLSDPYINEHAIRKTATQKALQKGLDEPLSWQESIGIIDVGSGVGGAIPIAYLNGAYLAAYYGFFGNAMLRYRRLELGNAEQTHKQFALPMNAVQALAMPAGSEIEFVGQGRLNMGGGGVIGGGIAAGPFWAGWAGVASATTEAIKEYSITVTSIDGNGRVRVILRKLNSSQVTASLVLAGGLISPGFDGPNLNEEGSLNFLAGNSSTIKSASLLLDHTSASIGIAASHLDKSALIAAYDLDLHNPLAAQAYGELLRLSPSNALKLAAVSDSGVKLLTVKEKQNDIAQTATVNFFGEKLLLSEKIDSHMSGEMVRRDGSQLNYREKIFEKRFDNFLSGKKRIRWEAVSMKEKDASNQDLFFRLNFERTDFEFVEPKLHRFYRFAQALGIPPTALINSARQSKEKFAANLSNAARVHTNIDIYFTNVGIDNIQTCDESCAVSIFIQSVLSIYPKYTGFPISAEGAITSKVKSALQEYLEITSKKHLLGLGYFRELHQLRAKYTKLTGRNIALDAKLFDDAEKFGNELQHLKHARDIDEANHFFSRLGKLKGFHFMGAMAALRLLAEKENAIVRELSISSRGIQLAYEGEPALRSPHKVIYEELTSY